VQSPPAGNSASAPHGSLPVLQTDAHFGWLPSGDQLRSGFESENVADMNVYAGKVFDRNLTIWAARWSV